MDSGVRAYQALSMLRRPGKSPYDLLVMDVVLGEALDGLADLRAHPQLFPAQKAIVASGHAPNERAELAVDKGLIWLAKPYTVEALTRAIEHVFAQG